MKRFFVFGIIALALLVPSFYLFDSNLRARVLADADSALAARARGSADSVDRTLQFRMTEVFTFAALPSLRGFAASDENARPARAATAQAELQSIVAADPNIRAASILDPLGTVI
ncbi:MAG: cache domain-containing protein, partial [Chloroflexota bacterium]|nr:cache domain-containing protein [Chloroflexota bacterium]